MDYNYKLPDNTFFHFHENEEGLYYSYFDELGDEFDGGQLVCNIKNITEKVALKKLSNFTGDNYLIRNDLKKISNEEFEKVIETKFEI